MRTFIVILALSAMSMAAPKFTDLNFKNLYKKPIREIKSSVNPRIIGGAEVAPNSVPYQAFLEVYTERSGWYCGGSIITSNCILTAGHCGDGGVEAHITLGAHTLDTDTPGQITVVSKDIVVHPDYDYDWIIYDIAIIHLSEPVTFTATIQPSPLPTSADLDNTYVGATATISGWGLTESFGNALSPVLKHVNVTVITNNECELDFGYLLPSIICTSGDERTGSCSGDSGGPLIVDGVQVGIVSFGIVYCLPGYASAFTRVTSFLDWISHHLIE